MKAVLVLENGAFFIGKHFGAPVNTSGEVGE
jgi:carbamoylphosphate synthase small subunit